MMPHRDVPGNARSKHARLLAAVVGVLFLATTSRPVRAQTTIIYFDNFAADPLGSVPVNPLIGQPWGISATSPNGFQVVADMIREASLSSYKIGSAGINYSDIDNITAPTSSPAAGSVTPTPEPGGLALLLAAPSGSAAWWLWRRRKCERGSLEERTNA